VADFAVRFNDFSGGDWGDADPARAKSNQFSGRNVLVYGDGLLGVRPGWKVLDPTGKAVGWPASYSGSVRGFDVMGNKLTIATVDKTYDLYWDLNLAAGGTLPANNPIPLPGGLAITDQVQFLRGADTAMKEFMLTGGKLYYRTGDPNGAWTLTGPAGKNLSTVTRWNLYLVAVDKDQPWIVWFSNVDANGPNFINWPAANYLFVGTTETITTLLSIFNMLYAGRTSGWWGISGVLGVLASVRELAIGNGPLDQRTASVTTDNRIAYWPMQKVPAFWNGERVQLVDDQRMDPRQQWLSTTPGFSKGGSASPAQANQAKITGDVLGSIVPTNDDGQNGYVVLDNPLRAIGSAWTAVGAKAVGAPTQMTALWNQTGPNQSFPPGWTRVDYANLYSGGGGNGAVGAQERPTIGGASDSYANSWTVGTRWNFPGGGRIIGARIHKPDAALPSTLDVRAYSPAYPTASAAGVRLVGVGAGYTTAIFTRVVEAKPGESWTFSVTGIDSGRSPIHSGADMGVSNTAHCVCEASNLATASYGSRPDTPFGGNAYVEPIFEPWATAPVTWSSPDGVPSAAVPLGRFKPSTDVRCYIRTAHIGTSGVGTGELPAGTALRLMVNGVELCRTTYAAPGWDALVLHAVTLIRSTDVLSVELYNPTAAALVMGVKPPSVSLPYGPADAFGAPSPLLSIVAEPAAAASYAWVCPATGRYDLHADLTGSQTPIGGLSSGNLTAWHQFNKNDLPVGSQLVRAVLDPYVSFDANDVALTVGDRLSLSYATASKEEPGFVQGICYVAGPEAVTRPMVKVTDRATKEIFGTLAIPGDAVVVTPTERRLMFLGDDGSTSKVWSYAENIWTHHSVPMLLGGMAPSDVRGAYQLPEHVVFATKRNYTAEPLRVWSIAHDIDRPALVSDQWASPYDQSMPTDVFVRGEASLPRWFDGQGRQSRVRSVIVQFRKWDQGVVGATNKITARIDACGPYEAGVKQGVEATWEEPMSGASPAGTDDSWRFNVGEQGFANGFQVVFTGLYGVAIREVVCTVDVRTERA
jgi:hypothetical protein